MQLHGVGDNGVNFAVKVPGLLQPRGKVGQAFGHNGIENIVCRSNRSGGANHPKFKFVSRKRKGRGTVAVAVVLRQLRQSGYAGFQQAGGVFGRRVAVCDPVERVCELVA